VDLLPARVARELVRVRVRVRIGLAFEGRNGRL